MANFSRRKFLTSTAGDVTGHAGNRARNDLSITVRARARRLRRQRADRHLRAPDLQMTLKTARSGIRRREQVGRRQQYSDRGRVRAKPDGYTLLSRRV